ncbi:glutathione S-transferase N-terminal domain-containing protein [Rhizobium sp. SJZ105]|uniref:glutathione S-transferase N-terminal domain-containing protein n=1 Tax=Rhizobium sp. SJZ105 TaxID=2572678 RepID=UPI0011A708CA|nr:glutathione S-transferase N-terminal domain-containing protein [Rhizobium sp. SJZ105]
MTAPLQLYYWPTPNGWKATIMLEELGVPYDVNFVDIVNGDQFDPAFLTISPNNRIPALVDPYGPNGEPLAIFESGAILQYLGRKFRRFYPDDDVRRTKVNQWLFWQVGGLGPMAGQAHHFRHYAPEKIDYAIDRYTKEVARLYGVLDRQLGDRDYLAGEYSIADIACVGWIVPHAKQGQDFRHFPRLERWFETVMARPAVQRGIAVGRSQRERTDFARIAPFRET